MCQEWMLAVDMIMRRVQIWLSRSGKSDQEGRLQTVASLTPVAFLSPAIRLSFVRLLQHKHLHFLVS